MRGGLARRAVEPDDAAVAIGCDSTVLDLILEPDTHLAVWRGAGLYLPGARDWDAIDDIDAEVAVETLGLAIPALLGGAGYADATRLAQEVIPLALSFAALMRCAVLRVRFDVIQTDACRKFHADMVTARLLLPLVGPGTQWMRAGGDPERPEGDLQAGDVGIFKGRLWTRDPVILHRSPPIAGAGITRVLLVIDPMGR